MKRFLILLICAVSLASCGKLTRREVLSVLNEGEAIPVVYHNIVVLDNEVGFWIGNTHQYNRGGRWSVVESADEVSRVHDFTPPELGALTPNSDVIDQNGRSIYVVNRRGCRGCDLCYGRFSDAGLVDYRVIKGEVGADDNLRVATSLTSKGAEYQLISEKTKLLQDNENQVLVKVAEYKVTKVLSVVQVEDSATVEVEYYLDYTPFAESLGAVDPQLNTTTLQLKESDEGWQVVR